MSQRMSLRTTIEFSQNLISQHIISIPEVTKAHSDPRKPDSNYLGWKYQIPMKINKHSVQCLLCTCTYKGGSIRLKGHLTGISFSRILNVTKL